jgi:hypothetical protein
MTDVLTRPRPVPELHTPAARLERGRRRFRAAPVTYLICFAAYATTGLYLSVGRGLIIGDALSRVADADFVLYSRQPHVAAVGFVFTPFTALVQLPLVAIFHDSPWLLSHDVTGTLMAAAFMAGSVVQVALIVSDRGRSALWSYGVAALYAIHPMIVYYGGNGMSEAPFLFCVTWAVRRLLRWYNTDDVHDLIAVGIALGLAYLARYDALAAGGVAVAFVAVVSATRAGGGGAGRRLAARRRAGLMDATIVALPIVLSFALWTATSWLLTGDAFAQFSSVYGNTAILHYSETATVSKASRLAFSLGEWLVLEPLLPLVLLATAVLMIRRRDLEPLCPALVLGSVLGFQTYSYLGDSTFPFLRYYASAIPLVAVLIGMLLPAQGSVAARRRGRAARSPRPSRPLSTGARLGALTVAAAVLAGGAVGSWLLMQSPTRAPQEYAVAAALRPSTASPEQEQLIATFSTERQLAGYLDSLHLPDGSVITDTVFGFAVVVASHHPQQFVIPSDRDFVTILNDPAAYGVQYILTVPPTGRGASDAVNRRYPNIYYDGGQISTLALEIPNDGADQPTWRLYHVIPQTG